MKMPKVSGIALKRHLHEICPEMKFLFLTGHGSEEAFKAGTREAGADCYMLKPVQIEALLANIHEALSERRKEAPDG